MNNSLFVRRRAANRSVIRPTVRCANSCSQSTVSAVDILMNLVIGGQGERWQASRFLAIMSVASLCLQCSINVSFSAVLISAFWRRRRARSCSFYAPLHTFAPDSKRNASYDASLMRLAVRWTGADKCGTESTV